MIYKPPPLGNRQFLQGVAHYEDHYAASEENRIVLLLCFTDDLVDYAIVDTGAPWSVLHPEIAQATDLLPINQRPSFKLNIRGYVVSGWLVRTRVGIQALQGTDLDIEATFFVPDVGISEWQFPNFIGYNGFLSVIRFAVDAANNKFYFGA